MSDVLDEWQRFRTFNVLDDFNREAQAIEVNTTLPAASDDALKSEEGKPTYKKILGFSPLQMTWGRFIIYAVLRNGDTHSNHADHAIKMLKHVVHMIRTSYRQNVPILIRLDSGFTDQELFNLAESLGICYICGGRFVNDIKALVKDTPESSYQHHFGKAAEDVWEFLEFGDRRANGKRFRRAIFWRPLLEEKQYFLPGRRPGTFIYTNLGMGDPVDQLLQTAGLGHMALAEAAIQPSIGCAFRIAQFRIERTWFSQCIDMSGMPGHDIALHLIVDKQCIKFTQTI